MTRLPLGCTSPGRGLRRLPAAPSFAHIPHAIVDGGTEIAHSSAVRVALRVPLSLALGVILASCGLSAGGLEQAPDGSAGDDAMTGADVVAPVDSGPGMDVTSTTDSG